MHIIKLYLLILIYLITILKILFVHSFFYQICLVVICRKKLLKYHKNLKKKIWYNNRTNNIRVYFRERRFEGGKILPKNLITDSLFSVFIVIIGILRSIKLRFVFLSQAIHSSSNLLKTLKMLYSRINI